MIPKNEIRMKATLERIEKSKNSSNNPDESDKITEQIELLSDLKEVKSSIKKNVTSDYVLASLDTKQKEFIEENYSNAEFAKELIMKFQRGYEYVWDEEKLDWVRDDEGIPKKVPIDDDKKKYIEALAKRTFEFFMITPHIIAILNRNKKDNPMVMKYMSNKEDEEEEPIMQMTKKGFFDNLKEKMGIGEPSDDGPID